jgi:hypothetical protein
MITQGHVNMHEHQLLVEHLPPDIYNPEYLKKPRFRIYLGAYPTSNGVHIQIF